MLFHLSLLTLGGSGSVSYDDVELDLDPHSDNYFVLQPGINLDMNVTTWFRAGNYEGLSVISTFLALRFGWF